MFTELESWLLRHALWLSLVIFTVAAIVVARWETHRAEYYCPHETKHRVMLHFSLAVIGLLATRLIFSLPVIYFAWLLQQDNHGLLNAYGIPYVIKVVLGLLLLDLTLYFHHRAMHKWAWFWRVHQVHHMDTHVDFTTGVRFHPLEVMVVTGFKIIAVIFFGIPVWAVFLYEIWLALALLFTHANVSLSPTLEQKLKRFIVTPSLHRIHHSVEDDEQKKNFGFGLIIWDKLFGTYKGFTRQIEPKMVFGLSQRRDKLTQDLQYLLLHPFGLKRYKQPRPRKQKLKLRASE